MIIIRLLGGIGNQLFIYAFGRALELKYKIKVFFDVYSGYRNDPYKRQNELYKFITNIKAASLYDSFFFPLKKRSSFLTGIFYPSYNYIKEDVSSEFDTAVLNRKNDNKIFIEGYWQNVSYYDNYSEIIRDELKNTYQLNPQNLVLTEKILNNNSIGIHIRRTSIGLIVPLKYYYNSVNEAVKKIPNPFFFCFSDDIEWCKKNLRIDYPIYFVDNNEPVEDFWLLSKCKNFIISNSTFAWWAAQLSEHKDKNIFTPPVKLWGSKNIIPKNWEVLNDF